ncbi:MAG: gamma-glutamylcyclotransferase [Microscillaceae bacterium]|nr:gamma-glutamylcyclotransferase [Microscillaceae bacterium]
MIIKYLRINIFVYIPDMPRLFVYGTLRWGQSNHHLLHTAQLLRFEVKIMGYEIRNNQFYPYAFVNPEASIVGEIYEVSNALLDNELDTLEGTAEGYYLRFWDEEHQFYIYLKGKDDREKYPLIESGDWLKP